ncbi:alpha/beta fold hydrolase [Nocardia sp. NPDC050412]|uniref:alpha/beta fold hydrolase n=1 Tax=Nocardia sp. NPDC050412 TaxID=3364320 RepID=UPI0037BCB0F6
MNETRVLADDGTGLHVELDGDRDAKRVIIFVSGINTALVYWSRQRKTLADLGAIVLFDHRGHGRSDESPVDSATVGQLGLDIAAIIDSVVPDRPVVLIAHSLGGMAVCALAAHRPELFGTRIVGVALLDTVPSRWGEIALRLPGFVTRVLVRALWRVVPPLRRLLTDTSERRHPTYDSSSQARTGPRMRLAHIDRARRLVTSVRTMSLLALIADTALCDHSAGLATLGTTPVLVVAGDGDRFIPLRYKTDAAASISGAQLVIIPDAGHLSSIKKPEEVDRHLRAFITSLDLAERRA